MRLLSIAFKNVFRNRKRTTFTLIAIAFSVCICVLIRGLVDATSSAIVSTITKSLTGQCQIFRKGYFETLDAMSLDKLISDSAADSLERIFADTYQDALISKRLRFSGIAFGKNDNTSVFTGVGIEPAKEMAVCPSFKKNLLSKGRYLSNDPQEALISSLLSQSLGLSLGDTIVIMSSTIYGTPNARQFTVAGIFNMNIPGTDARGLYIDLSEARLLLGTEKLSSEIAVGFSSRTISRSEFEKTIKPLESETSDVEIVYWEETTRLFKSIIGFQKIAANVAVVVFSIMAIAAILNTMLMAAMERIKEIGVVRALGMKRKQVLTMFFYESMIIGLIGGAIGLTLGAILVRITQIHPIAFYPPGSQTLAIFILSITVQTTIILFAMSIFISVVAVIYPAIYASRSNPADALRTI